MKTLFDTFDKLDRNENLEYVSIIPEIISVEDCILKFSGENYINKILQQNKKFNLNGGYSKILLETCCAVIPKYFIGHPYETIIFNQKVNCVLILKLGFIQMNSILRTHPFFDGNKRTAVFSGIYVIEKIIGEQISITKRRQQYLAEQIFKNFDNQEKTQQVWIDTFYPCLLEKSR